MAKINDWLEKDKLTLLEGWSRDGLTNEQIANNIGINVKTLYDWKNKILHLKGKVPINIIREIQFLRIVYNLDIKDIRIN